MQHEFTPDEKTFVFQSQNVLHLQPNGDFVLCELYMAMTMLKEIMYALQMVAACFYEEQTMGYHI